MAAGEGDAVTASPAEAVGSGAASLPLQEASSRESISMAAALNLLVNPSHP
ncbi:hypothetical protein D3C75_602650 [compost metagenome]